MLLRLLSCCPDYKLLDYKLIFMQIGDNTEIMYFVAKTEKDMEEWLAACRHGKIRQDLREKRVLDFFGLQNISLYLNGSLGIHVTAKLTDQTCPKLSV